jgi:preprotein translocase subunit YajC
MREQRQVLSAIAVGDAVITAGGIVGKVVETGNERLQLEIAEGVNVAVSSKHIDGVAGH